MKIMLSPAQQRWLALALAALVMLTAALFVALPLWAALTSHGEQISLLRLQAAKLEALTAARPRLEAAARAASADKTLQSLTFAAVQPSEGAAQLQSSLNQIFSAAGATVTSGQALEGTGDAPGKIAVRTVLETDIASLVRALQAIGSSRPLLTIEKMNVTEPDGEFTAVGPQPAVANKLIVEIVVSARLRGS
jgi:hypothetical protein